MIKENDLYFCSVWIGKDTTEVNRRMTNLKCLTMTLCMIETGHDPWPQQGMLSLKCTDDCIKENQSYFFQETGLDLIILLKFLFLWNIWPFYKITCIFTFITEVRVEPDPRTLIRGHWREPRLVSSLLLFCQVSRIYMNVHVGYLSFTSILL